MKFIQLNLYRAYYKHHSGSYNILFSANDLREAFEFAEEYRNSLKNCTLEGVSCYSEKLVSKSYE